MVSGGNQRLGKNQQNHSISRLLFVLLPLKNQSFTPRSGLGGLGVGGEGCGLYWRASGLCVVLGVCMRWRGVVLWVSVECLSRCPCGVRFAARFPYHEVWTGLSTSCLRMGWHSVFVAAPKSLNAFFLSETGAGLVWWWDWWAWHVPKTFQKLRK